MATMNEITVLENNNPSKQVASTWPLADKRLISVDDNSGVPLWIQLRNRLVFLIVSGAYPAGIQLPTVRELSTELNLNYNTVARVYRDIEHDGYVVTRRGKGTYVAEINTEEQAGESISAAQMLVERLFEECKELGLNERDTASLVATCAGGVFV